MCADNCLWLAKFAFKFLSIHYSAAFILIGSSLRFSSYLSFCKSVWQHQSVTLNIWRFDFVQIIHATVTVSIWSVDCYFYYWLRPPTVFSQIHGGRRRLRRCGMHELTPTQRFRNGSSIHCRDHGSSKSRVGNSGKPKCFLLHEVWCYISLRPNCCLYVSLGCELGDMRVAELGQWYLV